MASAISEDSIQTNSECSTLYECCTEVNEVSSTTSQMVIVTQKMIKLDDVQTEFVDGNFFITHHFCNYFSACSYIISSIHSQCM